MTTSTNALHLHRSALNLIEQLETKPATRIAATVSEWNICVDQAGFTGTFDFPTTGYTRKAKVIADLKRCAEQLQEISTEADRKAGRPVDEEGNNTREWCGNDIEAAHAEALDINRWIDDAHCVGGVAFKGAADAIIAVRERDHAEAVEEDARFNWLASRFGIFQATTARVQLEMLDEAHHEALVINARRRVAEFFGGMDYGARCAALDTAHAEALVMDEEISLVREIESLTYEQAIAYSDQADFFNSAPEAQAQMVEAAHAEALVIEAEEDHELALAINRYFDALRWRFDLFWSDSTAAMRDQVLAAHHENALRLNALIDGLANEIREAIAEAHAEAESHEGQHVVAIKIEATGPELERADIAFAAETAGRVAGVAA